MPYRIPGALDYGDYPILKILHVEKCGRQFHETSISVSHRGSFMASDTNRSLFHYRFQKKYGSDMLPEALIQRVHAMIQAPEFVKREPAAIKPLRAWNADGWYFILEGSGIHSANSENGISSPQEIVALFNDIEATPRSSATRSDSLKDVCLGFGYDPISALGYLYSNHRCFNAGRGFVCR
jgi:hypothetical protein